MSAIMTAVQLTLEVPDLVRESRHRAAIATLAEHDAFGPGPVPYAGAVPYLEGITDEWADPYGPDPVVFGDVPCVRDGWL